MYSNFPHIATAFGLEKLTVRCDDWYKQGNFMSGKIHYKSLDSDVKEEVTFRLLENELNADGFPKLQIGWSEETKVYDLSEDKNSKSDSLNAYIMDQEWNLVEAFGLAVIHTHNEIAGLINQKAFQRHPSSWH